MNIYHVETEAMYIPDWLVEAENLVEALEKVVKDLQDYPGDSDAVDLNEANAVTLTITCVATGKNLPEFEQDHPEAYDDFF